MSAQLLLLLAGFYGFTGVALGAFAAHALQHRLDDYALGILQTGTQYQLLHAVALLALAGFAGGGRLLALAGGAFALGILLFSGSLYALAFTGVRGLGVITPIGGTLLLAGWLLLLIYGLGSR